MAICSTSSARAAAWSTSRTSPMRREPSSACRIPSLSRQSSPRQAPAPTGSPEAARRLFAMSQPIPGTLVETYLRKRGITALHETGSLRFHPRCYYRPDEHQPTETWPAMIASVTDLGGRHHRRASHLARTRRQRQGADRHAAGGRWATSSATPSGSAWRTT